MSVKLEYAKMPVPRRRFLQGAGAVAATTALAAPGSRAFAQSGSGFRMRSYSDLRTYDPSFSAGVPDGELQNLVFVSLIGYKPGRVWEWKLDGAAEMEQTDPTHIRFALRDDIGFGDGFGAVTAEDVKFSFERVADPALESNNAPDWEQLDEVQVTGERTGVIALKKAFPPLWLTTLTNYTGIIVSKRAVEALDGKRMATEPVAQSGPYRLKSWTPRQSSSFVRNPDWAGERYDFDTIDVFPIDDEATAEIAFEAGEIDFTRVSLASVERLRTSPPAGATLDEYPSLFYVWLGMNVEHPKLRSRELRQAIQYAIDVPTILEAAYFGAVEPSTGIIAPGLTGNRPAGMIAPEANLERARELLEASGETGVSLTLNVINKTDFTTAAQVIQANLAAIGIDVEIIVNDSGTFWALGDENAGDAWRDLQLVMNRFSMRPDPSYATTWFTQEQVGVWNWERFRSEEFDRLHNAAATESDVARRDEMYRKAQDLMEESGAYRFITHEATPVIYASDRVVPALRPDGLPLLRDFRRA
ncbi:MAG: ABC transporter substrate-binding protein [Alphaproteobacteria bacterium]|nr:ABC transporter substrate-binding protein [Alphaproteobacteria bacterium]MDA8004654.1 ABC transporter substrate-binding protein [Alphaproteobacteria bacterium]MDA8005664.1 ABC transporter substrate-binding protein [Alphaproteobacteria bacterium]MDA8013835.1 ABC transporter substrate-binding protein [Alphaproteobacteria bacterium]